MGRKENEAKGIFSARRARQMASDSRHAAAIREQARKDAEKKKR
jgi:hypothetical protein